MPKLKCSSSRLAIVFAQSTEARCYVEDEGVVGAAPIGDAPTTSEWLSGVPDYFDRNKILSGYDLSHYQVPHCIKSFLLFCLICVYSSQF